MLETIKWSIEFILAIVSLLTLVIAIIRYIFITKRKEVSSSLQVLDMPDEIFFDLDKDEKVLKLIPIIKDIDNPENLSNKFKLGIVTSFVKTTKEVSKE